MPFTLATGVNCSNTGNLGWKPSLLKKLAERMNTGNFHNMQLIHTLPAPVRLP